MGTVKKIELESNSVLQFARQYLEIIDAFNHLSDGEKDVLSYIMTSQNAFIQDDSIREKLLLDYDVKSYIMQDLDITEARLNNVISSLRKRDVIIKTKSGNKLNGPYDFMREVELPFQLTFIWTLNQDGQG